MKRIVIQLSELSHENWTCIYRFIERCRGCKQYSESDFIAMKNKGFKIGIDDNPKTNCDVCSITEEGIKELRYETLPEKGDLIFNIIYVKTDNREEFSDFTRFFLLKKKYAGRITLGINLDILSIRDFNKYKFQLGFFLFFIKNRKPDMGNNSLYIIYSEGTSLRTTAIPYMNDNTVPNYEKASPYIFPLIPINKSTFGLFETHDISTNNERIKVYIENSIINGKKKRELKNKSIDTKSCHSLFEEWFLVSYLASDCKAKTTVILSYCDSIRELVQNVIFHTKEQQGLLYVVFNKKEKVSKTLNDKIPEFDSYGNDQRFVEIGVFDYNEMGIVDTFTLSHNHELFDARLKLDDFLDPKKILPDEAEYISMRFAAHLGIKSFVASVMYHKGFFRVESNNSIGENKDRRYLNNKERFENRGDGIVRLSAINDIDGTQYEIVLPPIEEGSSYSYSPIGLQASSVSNILTSRLKGTNKKDLIKEIQFDAKCDIELGGEENERKRIGKHDGNNLLKQKQEDAIRTLGEQILKKVSQHLNSGGQQVALNLSSLIAGEIYYTQFLKLLAYFQPVQQQKGCLIFTQIEEVTIDKLCHQLNGLINRLDERGHPIWSDDHPIVLIGKAGTTRILAGKTKEEMIYVNHGINLLYITQGPFPENEKDVPVQLDKSRTVILQKLIKLYDCYIDSENAGLPVFISRVENLLDKQLGSVGIGCRVDVPTKIGSKLYLDNYYEADFLFQNNFFTDRFAYFIAKEIITMCGENVAFMGKKLVLIGYNPYSAPLAERVKDYVNDYFKYKIEHKNEKNDFPVITDIVIAKEKDKEKGLEFKMSKLQANRFLTKQYRFITIVPIGSTLSTTDKIIALFSKELNDYFAQNKKKSSFLVFPIIEKPNIEFVYNHVTILVRHKINSQPAKIEISRNWKDNGIFGHTIRTLYHRNNPNGEGIKVDFLIEKEGVWHELINEVVDNKEVAYNNHVDKEILESKGTFPAEDWQCESYINKTKNASLNTEEKFGFPNVVIPDVKEIKSKLSLTDDYDTSRVMNEYYRDSVQKLYEIREFIYFGHIIHGGSHHRFYFDIEQLFSAVSSLSQPSQPQNAKQYSNASHQLVFFEKQVEQIKNIYYPCIHSWLDHLYLSCNNTLSVIITPDYDYESVFISTINRKVFNDNAFVIYLNINNPLQNNKLKLSYLKSIKFQETKYYFVDQALLTGSTYYKTRSYMASILGDYDFKFDGIITVVNRLSKEKYREVQHGLKMDQGIYSFLQFFVLPSKEMENNCSLCDFHNLYENLKNYSVNEDCEREIERNRRKYTPQSYSHYFDEKETNNNDSKKAVRKISNSQVYWLRMIWKHRLFYELGQMAEQEGIGGKTISKEQVYYHLRELYINEDPEINGMREDSFDNKISFLKAITFPPLSQYVVVRYSAHRLQLELLRNLLEKPNPDYNDLNLLLVLLKHLAILGSNALVRKDVIEKSWRLYFHVFGNDQKKHIKRAEKRFPIRFVFYIKLATYKDEAKSLWLGELLRRGTEMIITNSQNRITIKKTELFNSFFHTFDEDLNKANEESNKELAKCIREYKEVFLPLLFYDNTAITRKTLNNFVLALEKDSNLKKLFYEEGRKEGKEVLRSFTRFSEKSNLTNIVKRFKEKIDQEYYYAWFRLFIDKENKSPDGIPILEKFVYVLYERLLLMDLTDSNTKNFKPFDQNAKDLLEVAAKVMDADAAFISIKKGANDSPYVLARYNTQVEESAISNCYGTKLLQEEIGAKKGQPFVILKDLSHQEEQKLETKGFDRATYLMLNNSGEKSMSQSALIGVVTFLYNDKDLTDAQNIWNNEKDEKRKRKANFKIMATHDRFMKNAQELGRLLLLLKPQMDKYVRHVDDEKQFEVWKEKEKFKTKYNAMWLESDHAFKKLIMPDIEKLDSYEKVPQSWYRLANIIITNLYVIFEKNRDYAFENKYFDNYALSDVLEPKFEKLIEKSPHWIGERRGNIAQSKSRDNHNTIFKYDEDFDPKIKICTNKFILQSFVYMCVYNAFYHERNDEKTVSITISKDNQGVFIEIINDFPGMSQAEFSNLKTKFDNRYNPKGPNTWESIFDNFGEGITISTIRKCFKNSSFHFIQKRIEGKDVFCFSSKIYPDRKE